MLWNTFFTSQIIRNISDDHEILCVVTTEDTQQGRGKRILPSDVKTANELNIPLLQPKHLNDKEFITDLINYNADLFLVVALESYQKMFGIFLEKEQ